MKLARATAGGLLLAAIAFGRTARPLVPEAERLTGADLPSKHLIFTFDQGPSATTVDLTKYLHAHEIHATFFVDARYVGKEPALQAIIDEGQRLGNRASTNQDLVTQVPLEDVVAEVAATDELISPFVAWNRKFFRAPFGSWTKAPAASDAGDAGDLDAVFHTLEKTKLNEYVGPIHWNVDADCSALSDAQCADAYLQRIHAKGNGIVRFDDTEQTFAVVKLLVPQLEIEAYAFSELEDVPAVTPLLGKCNATCGACTGPTENDCSSCAPGARLVSGQCLACSVCQPGHYAVNGCSAAADTLCAPCPASSYQPAPGTTSCLACGDCSDGDACTTDTCHPVTGCTHAKIPGCPAPRDASASVPPFDDAGGSRPTTGTKIDDDNNIAASVDEEESGCAMGGDASSTPSTLLVVALCIAVGKKRRQRNRSLSL